VIAAVVFDNQFLCCDKYTNHRYYRDSVQNVGTSFKRRL